MSSSSTTGSSGFFVVRTKRHQLRPRRMGLASLRAVRSDRPSATTAMPSTANATIGESRCSGWKSLSMPSTMANMPPRVKSTSDTTNAQK